MKYISLVLVLVALISGCSNERPPEQPEPTGDIVIDGMTKKTVGVLQGLQSGDVACYAQLMDESGESFSEMAFYEICDLTHLVGRRVVVDYEMGNVLADSCQGDPDCGESQSVPLIFDMRPETAPGELSGFVHQTDFQMAGYFTPKQILTVGEMTFHGVYIPADTQEMFDTGEGERHAFILDFEAGGGYEKVFPDAYLVTSSEVKFIGTDARIGAVSFKGVFDTEAMRAALESGQTPPDAVMLTGTLTINGREHVGIEFSLAPN